MHTYCDKQWDQVQEYIDGIRDGSIISCKEIKLAVERFVQDNKRDDIEVRVDQVDLVFKFFSILNAESDDEIKQFKLLPFQSFIIAALFGPYKKGTPHRKYTEAFLYMARKNGKTTFASALQIYFLLMDGEIFPQSILIAHSRDQSRRALEALQGMVMYTPSLAEKLKFNNRSVYIGDGTTQGFSETVPSKEASLQGYKLSTCILDEIHTYSDQKLYTAAKKGMSSKTKPMLLMLSTAGDESKTFCKDRIAYAQKVLRGDIDDDSSFAMLYMLDKEDLTKWNKEECWYKSNPALGQIKRIDFLRDELKKAKYFPSSRYDFLTYELNMYTDSMTKWISQEYLDRILKELDRTGLLGREVYLGADFSEVKDLSSVALLFPYEDGEDVTFKALIYYIIPNIKEKQQRKGNINLKAWIEEDHIIQCQKPIIDDEEILDLLRDIEDKYDICGFGYDKRAATKLIAGSNQFISERITKPIQQGFGLSSAIKEIQSLIETEKLTIDNNPVTNWNFNNVHIGHDDFGNWSFRKTKSLDAIDGLVALTNAYKSWELEIYGGSGLVQELSLLSK